MGLSESFENAVKTSRNLEKPPSNEQLLRLYCLYKQAIVGDAPLYRPGGFDFKALAKYDAWASLAGMPKKEAMKAYIELVDSLRST